MPEILNTGETLGESSIRTQESTTITKNQRYQISPEIIDEFLDKLGKNNVTRKGMSSFSPFFAKWMWWNFEKNE